jgi:hypothetical protein
MSPVHAFVLIPREKRLLIFILAAFVLGVATKHYRDTHPPAAVPEKTAGKSPSRRSAPQGLAIPAKITAKQKADYSGSD